MADFNSRFTGAEIEAAIAKTDKIGEFVDMTIGAPTNSPIPLSSLPMNPATGDRTGLYYILTNDNASAVTGESTNIMYIYDESVDVQAAGHNGGYQDHTIFNKSIYDGGNISAIYGDMNVQTGAYTQGEIYIHKIFRFQEAQ